MALGRQKQVAVIVRILVQHDHRMTSLAQYKRRAALVLGQTRHSVVMLNKYPYNNGHLLLAPKRHEKNLSALSAEEYADLNEALRCSVDIVRRALNPGGINLGMNLGKCAGA